MDEGEHSIEMHLPYVYKVLERQFGKGSTLPKIVPILVGSIDARQEAQYGKLLKPYLEDEENCFVISSDFCHWYAFLYSVCMFLTYICDRGTRFSYTYYIPNEASRPRGQSLGHTLKAQPPPSDPPIWSAIETLDKLAIDSIETGKHKEFTDYLHKTKNTVCGRHPIGVMMGALEADTNEPRGIFKFVRYEQSSKCFNIRDSSVSYASAFAVISKGN